MIQLPIRVLDLFAGAGGLTAGFHAASTRFMNVAAVELDPSAAASYEATYGPGVVFQGAIEEWLKVASMPESIDIIVGGPPCQGFSTLGKQNVEDERNQLWYEYAKTLTRVRPKYFVVENVAAFARSEQFQLFIAATQRGGFLEEYTFDHRVLNAADYGAAQARKRAVLIGHHRDLESPGFPEPTHTPNPERSDLPSYRTVGDVFASVPIEPDRDHVLANRFSEWHGKHLPGPFSLRELHWSRSYTERSMERFRAIPRGGNRFNLPEELKARCWVGHTTGSADVMGRLHQDRPSVTIRTEFFKPEKGRYLHPSANRAITHYEAALLQGFTDSHQFVGSKVQVARQIGNAVPLSLGSAIASRLEKVI